MTTASNASLKEMKLVASNDHPFKIRPQIQNNGTETTLSFEICGTVVSPAPGLQTNLLVRIYDITQSATRPLAVRNREDAGETVETVSYTLYNGVLPEGRSLLKNWTPVLTVDIRSLAFARKGVRQLQFSAAVVCDLCPEPLASAHCALEYHNSEPGYLDEIELGPYIEQLSGQLIATFDQGAAETRGSGRLNLKNSLKALCFKGLSCVMTADKMRPRLCRELAQVATRKQLISILAGCMDAVREHPPVSLSTLYELRKTALLFYIAPGRFRSFLEVHIPVSLHQDIDTELILGIEPEMPAAAIRQLLGREYSKWNARVTHTDSEVRQQAALMLDIIGQARTQYK